MAGKKSSRSARLHLNEGRKPHLPKKVTIHARHATHSDRVKHGRQHLVKERGAFN